MITLRYSWVSFAFLYGYGAQSLQPFGLPELHCNHSCKVINSNKNSVKSQFQTYVSGLGLPQCTKEGLVLKRMLNDSIDFLGLIYYYKFYSFWTIYTMPQSCRSFWTIYYIIRAPASQYTWLVCNSATTLSFFNCTSVIYIYRYRIYTEYIEYIPVYDFSNKMKNKQLRGCPYKNRPLNFRPKTEFLQIFCVRYLVHVINKNSNNLALSAIFQYFWWRIPNP